ncbi:MAG: YdcF family protein, partial [Micrococcales bacterium]|nr:YdcF family protein [Micrococcales bacterium]
MSAPRTRKRRVHVFFRFIKWLLSLAIGLALLVFGGSTVIVAVQARPNIYAADTVPAHDVALVMGAAMWGKTPSPALQKRLDVAAQLYNSGKIKVIIVSGHVDFGYNEPAGMAASLMAAGVPQSKIVKDDGGDDTYSSCARALDVFGVSSLIVVTQTYHVTRAVGTCRLLHIDAVGVGT